MKLVASSKLKGVEDALARAKPFGESLLNAIVMKEEAPKAAAGAKVDEDAAKGIFLDGKSHLVVLMSTDRGLCGSVNSSLARALRKELNAAAAAKANLKLYVLGEKGRAQIARDYFPILAGSVDSYMDRDPVFPLAASIASKIIKEPYDVLTLFFNQYENQVKFHQVYPKIPQFVGLPTGTMPGNLVGYDAEPSADDETFASLQEYSVASAIYYAMLHTQACETSQRVTAMDNASTNAKDMVSRFKLIFNRARQAKITTELTEIISGAESIADAK
jgi:F-type H+-transporting ATPase subunit gamma